MRDLIKHILNESKAKNDILDLINDEDIFVAAKFVGGFENLKSLLKDEPEFMSLIDALKGTLTLNYHSRKQYLEFPMKFEIVGKGGNVWKTNTWPIINLIYNDSMFTDSEKVIFNSFVFDAINDLNIGNVDINPKADKLFRDSSYYDVKFVNGESYKDIEYEDYDDDDINYLNKLYKIGMNLKENAIIKENEEDPTQKILNFLLRRYKVEEKNYGDDDDPIIHKTVCFEIAKREVICVNQFMNKQSQIRFILNGLKHVGIVDDFEYNETRNNPYAQKAIRAVKSFLNQVMYNESNMNESKKLRESIKNVLNEEVTKKYSKPNEKLDKLVYNWLDNYFEGSQIYDREYWKYHGFQYNFCKNGREIADLRIIFDDKSPDWGPSDKRPTSERSVEEVMLYIYPIMIDELITDIPIRKNYLLYLIEEWFEDTQLDKIQQDFNRNDFSLDYITVFSSKKRGDICVPPVQKPEGVTMQEMMDYIKKNTLYSYKDMEKHEEDEPGWIEKTYLGKLWGKEHERVNQEDRENNPPDYNDGY